MNRIKIVYDRKKRAWSNIRKGSELVYLSFALFCLLWKSENWSWTWSAFCAISKFFTFQVYLYQDFIVVRLQTIDEWQVNMHFISWKYRVANFRSLTSDDNESFWIISERSFLFIKRNNNEGDDGKWYSSVVSVSLLFAIRTNIKIK